MNRNENHKWHTVGASAIGTSHLRNNKPYQDAFTYRILPSGLTIIVVADGAGSAAKADEGSFFATQTARFYLESQVTDIPDPEEMQEDSQIAEWAVLIQTAFEAAQDVLAERAAADERPLHDYATTLLVMLCTETWAICGLVGDCAAVIQTENTALFSLCRPQKGEYANTTNFLTQPNALEQLDIQCYLGPIYAAAAFSDGLLELALNIAQNQPYTPFFDPLFKFAASSSEPFEAETQLTKFLQSDRVNARTDDDKTLVIISQNMQL